MSTSVSVNSGAIIGVMLDFELNQMFFSLNGALLTSGFAFSGNSHGPRPGRPSEGHHHNRVDAAGADWSNGFSPFLSLGPGEGAELNVGLFDFVYPLEGCNLIKRVSGKDFPLPPAFLRFSPSLQDSSRCGDWLPVATGPKGIIRDDADDNNYMSLTLLQNMRLCFKIGCRLNDIDTVEVSQFSCVSKKAVKLNVWTHCLLRVDEDSVDFVVNGVSEEHQFSNISVLFNDFPFGIGLCSSSLR